MRQQRWPGIIIYDKTDAVYPLCQCTTCQVQPARELHLPELTVPLCMHACMYANVRSVQVDGIYDSDPHKNPTAKRYSHLSYRKCVVDDLKVRSLRIPPPSRSTINIPLPDSHTHTLAFCIRPVLTAPAFHRGAAAVTGRYRRCCD